MITSKNNIICLLKQTFSHVGEMINVVDFSFARDYVETTNTISNVKTIETVLRNRDDVIESPRCGIINNTLKSILPSACHIIPEVPAARIRPHRPLKVTVDP